jgi:hypothetical protein
LSHDLGRIYRRLLNSLQAVGKPVAKRVNVQEIERTCVQRARGDTTDGELTSQTGCRTVDGDGGRRRWAETVGVGAKTGVHRGVTERAREQAFAVPGRRSMVRRSTVLESDAPSH